MEDLTITATTLPMIPGFSHNQICSIIDELAKVHASSWKNRNWLELINVSPEEDTTNFLEFIKTMANTLKTVFFNFYNHFFMQNKI